MFNYLRGSGNKILATLAFYRKELIYDIENICYVEGDIIPGKEEDTRHLRHSTQDVGQKGNVDRVTRQLDLRIAEVAEVLYPYSKKDIPICGKDETPEPWTDGLNETPEYRIGLKLPNDFSETTLVYFERLIHDYLVARCVEDWLLITIPEKGKVWASKADLLLENLRAAKFAPHMRRKTRRPMHPF